MRCSKKHKLWSQCSGVRDPATYVKRSELATPAGIDRDFNFLVGIERKIEKVERKCAERGIDVTTPDGRGYRPPQKGEYNLKRAMESCGVVVDVAPKGMQRSRENLTHWNKKHKCLAWTVEWFHDNSQRSLGTALENLSIEAAYSRLKGESQVTSPRKRKLDNADEPEPRPTTEDVETARQSSPPIERHFYILRPRTPGPSRVLIPLSNLSTLSASLKGREVLEFPTIYVLSEPPSALPQGFILESQYLNQSAESSPASVEAILSRIVPPEPHQEVAESGPELGFSEGVRVSGAAALNEEKILDVLYKDLGDLQ